MKYKALLLLLLLPTLLQAQTSTARPLVLADVTVIDATGAAARHDMTVVISGERIAALGKAGTIDIPKGARVVDARGKFLIPGLWDMHVHLAVPQANKAINKQVYLPLLIANGVTGVRDMYSVMETIDAWRKEIAAGTLLGPRIVATGHILDGPGTRDYTVVRNAAEARQAVTAVKQEGSDFVKVYSVLPREGYLAIVDEAKRQHIPFAGHVPLTVSVAEASDAGQRSIEHMTGMVLAVSSREAELRRQFAPMSGIDIIAARNAFDRIELQAIDSFSAPKANQLFSRLARNDTWECPTLVVLRSMAFMQDPDFIQDSRLKYMTSATRRRWTPEGEPELRRQAEEIAADKTLYRKKLELVGAMQRAGVGILAGTDMTNPYVFPGFSLHDELELMVQAGLTPLQALQSATVNPARYFGKQQDLGSIGVGKLADLVLLGADPLLDIGNTRQIDAVVVAGKLIDKSQRDALLAAVEAAVAEK